MTSAELASLLEASGVGVWVYDQAQGEVQVSEPIRRLLGTPDAELPARPEGWLERVHPEDRPRLLQLLERAAETLQVDQTLEVRLRAADRQWLRVRLCGRVTHQDGQTPIRWAGTLQALEPLASALDRQTPDETGKATERRSTEDGPSWHQRFDGVDQAIFVQDQEGRFLDVNAAAEHLYGYPRAWLIGRRPLDLAAPGRNDLRASVSAFVASMSGVPQRVGFWGVRADGEVFFQEVVLTQGTYFGRPVVIAIATDMTEHRNAQRELEAERALLRSLLHTLPDLVWLTDPEGRFLYCNSRFEDFCGKSEQAIRGRLKRDVLSPQTNEPLSRLNPLAMEERAPRTGEAVLTFANGRDQGLFEIVRTPMRDAEGDLIGVLSVARDMTDLKATQQQLAEREEMLAAVIGQAGDAIEVVDAETLRFIEVNDTACAMLGYPREEILETTLDRVQAQWSSEEIHARIAQIVAKGGARFETLHRRRDGSIIEVQVHSRPVRVRGRLMLVAVSRDIGQANAIQRRLREEAARRSIYFEGSREGIVLIASDGAVIEANERFAEMLGYSPSEVQGLHIWDWDVFYSRDELLGMLAASSMPGETFVTQHRRKDGQVIDVEISAHSAVIDGRKVVFSLCRDVTERRAQERRTRDRARVLEMLVDGTSQEELLETLVRNLEAELPNARCGIMLLDESGERFGASVAPRLPDFFSQAVVGIKIGPGVGSCAAAAYEQSPVLVEDVEQHPYWSGLLALTRAAELRACWSVPIMGAQGRCLGTTAVYYREPRRPDPGELEQVQEIAQLAGITIQRHATLGALRDREEIYSAIVNQAADTIMLIDPRTQGFVEANPAAYENLGYSREEFRCLRACDVAEGESEAEVAERIQQIISHGQAQFEAGHRTRTGDRLDVQVSARAVEVQGQSYISVIARDVTPERRALTALAESEQRFRKLFEDSAEASFLIEDGRFIDCNRAALEMLGLERVEQIYDLHPSELSPERQPDGQPSDEKADAMIAHAFAEGRNLFEWEHLRAGGRPFMAEVLLTPIHYRDRRVLHVVWRDITERKRVERELRISRDRLAQAMRGSNDGLWDWNLETGEVYYSPRWKAMLGYREDELAHDLSTWSQLVHPEDEARALEQVQAYLAGRAARYNIELRMRHKEGHWLDILARAGDARDADGKPSSPRRLVGTHVDITERKRTEAALRESELFLRQTQKVGAIGGWRADLVSSELTWTEGVYHLLDMPIGYRPTLEEGLSFYTPESRLRVEAALTCATERGDPFIELVEIMPRSGGSRLVELRGAPHFDERARIQCVIGTLQDVTERVAAERELQGYREFLELKVLERTAELARAKEQAEDASRAKSTFLANMSHEIRTPMNAIMGLAHLLKQREQDPLKLSHVENISAAAQHLLQIINDILDLSKIEAGKLTLNVDGFDLYETMQAATGLVATRASEKGLLLTQKIDERLGGGLMGDAHRLGQVLLNLLSNAVKFTEKGSVRLEAAPVEPWQAPWSVCLSVRDTGIGIDQTHLERLFQPFEQADGSTTRRYGGTGLGLVICQRLVGLMGGEIGVDSRPGEGSTFWITLPLRPCERDEHALAEVVGETSDFSALAGRRVLLVEDNPINQEVGQALLEDVGIQVALAEDGRQAVSMAESDRYDVILMDMQMPELDGLEATRAIRRLPGCAEVPIIAMTANAFDEDRDRCLTAGMNDHVPKPTDPDVLYRTLRRWLR